MRLTFNTSPRLWLAFVAMLAIVLVGCGRSAQDESFAKTTQLRDAVVSNPHDDASLKRLITLLDDPYELTRENAAGCLRQLGENRTTRAIVAPAAVPALALHLATAGKSAAEALGEYGSLSAPAIPQLISAVDRYPDRDIGWVAAIALGKIGPEAAVAIPQLKIASQRQSIGKYANQALQQIEAGTAVHRSN